MNQVYVIMIVLCGLNLLSLSVAVIFFLKKRKLSLKYRSIQDAEKEAKTILIRANKEREKLVAQAKQKHIDATKESESILTRVNLEKEKVIKQIKQAQAATAQKIQDMLAVAKKEGETILSKASEEREAILAKVNIEEKNISEKLERAKVYAEDAWKAAFDKQNALATDYDTAYSKYLSLVKEVGILEDSAALSEVGIYKPFFSYGTSDEYKDKLQKLFEKQRAMLKNDKAVMCCKEWMVGDSRREGQKMVTRNKKLTLRAFSGECDAIISKVNWDNVNKMEERIKRAFTKINELNSVLDIQVTEEYLNLKLHELFARYELANMQYKEKEDRKRIAEELKEEEKILKEAEKAMKEVETEEQEFQKALDKAKDEFSKTAGEEAQKLSDRIKELETELKMAMEKKERVKSRAEQTKSGYVYFLSNIGSFGENIFKIGLTRRFEPMDRVKELSGAAVPFEYDVHALLFSANAPELETKLHKHFNNNKVNLINNRKEFFNITSEDIVNWAKNEGIKLAFSSTPEARTYRESLALKMDLRLGLKKETVMVKTVFAEHLFS